jgi:protein TonB
MKNLILILAFTGISYFSFAQVNQQVVVNQEAQFPGGDQAMVQYIYQNIKWPEATKGNLIMDDITISLDVLPDSTITNIVLLKKVGFGIDEVVLDLLKKIKFIPSVQNGTAVKMNIMIGVPIQVRN